MTKHPPLYTQSIVIFFSISDIANWYCQKYLWSLILTDPDPLAAAFIGDTFYADIDAVDLHEVQRNVWWSGSLKQPPTLEKKLPIFFFNFAD